MGKEKYNNSAPLAWALVVVLLTIATFGFVLWKLDNTQKELENAQNKLIKTPFEQCMDNHNTWWGINSNNGTCLNPEIQNKIITYEYSTPYPKMGIGSFESKTINVTVNLLCHSTANTKINLTVEVSYYELYPVMCTKKWGVNIADLPITEDENCSPIDKPSNSFYSPNVKITSEQKAMLFNNAPLWKCWWGERDYWFKLGVD